MNKASKLVGAAVVGLDSRAVIVNGTAYVVQPPTIERIAGASYYLSDVEDCESIADLINGMKQVESAAKALAWFVCEPQETKAKMIDEVARLTPILAKGSIEEVVEGLSVAYSMIGIENFRKLSALARNVGMLTARQKPQEMRVS